MGIKGRIALGGLCALALVGGVAALKGIQGPEGSGRREKWAEKPPHSQAYEEKERMLLEVPALQPGLLRSASLQVEVGSVGEASARIEKITADLGGRIVGLEASTQERGKGRGQAQLRVPLARYQEALASLRGLGKVEGELLKAGEPLRCEDSSDFQKVSQCPPPPPPTRAPSAAPSSGPGSALEMARLAEARYRAEMAERVQMASISLQIHEAGSCTLPPETGRLAVLGDAARQGVDAFLWALGLILYGILLLLPWAGMLLGAGYLIRKAWKGRKVARNGQGPQDPREPPAGEGGGKVGVEGILAV